MKSIQVLLLSCSITFGLADVSLANQPEKDRREAKSAEIDLRPKFQVGKDVKFKMTMTSTTREGKESSTDSSQEMTLRFKAVKSDHEKGTTLEMTYEALKLSMGDITFDSSTPADASNPMDGLLRSIVGLKMKVEMDANGNISSVTSDDSQSIGGMLSEQFTGADVIKGLFGPISSKTLSTGRAKIGDSWKSDDSMAGALGGMKIAMTHTLESVTGGNAKIRTIGKVVLEASESLPGGVAIKDSRITGTTRWDIESGMLDQMTQENMIEIDSADEDGARSTRQHSMKVEVARLR